MAETSPSKKLSMSVATLNMYLEEALQVTVRRSQATSFTYIGEDYGDILSSSNISAIVFEKINQHSRDLVSAISYLYASYRRVLGKESTIPASCRDEFLK